MKRRDAISAGSPAHRPIDTFDYAAAAEVFITAGGFSRGAPMTYRRFSTAAAAIRFAIEEVPPTLLVRATMEVSENRFDHQAIQTLYESDAYPLRRAKPQAKGTAGKSPATRQGTRLDAV